MVIEKRFNILLCAYVDLFNYVVVEISDASDNCIMVISQEQDYQNTQIELCAPPVGFLSWQFSLNELEQILLAGREKMWSKRREGRDNMVRIEETKFSFELVSEDIEKPFVELFYDEQLFAVLESDTEGRVVNIKIASKAQGNSWQFDFDEFEIALLTSKRKLLSTL